MSKKIGDLARTHQFDTNAVELGRERMRVRVGRLSV
jgi:hypothetical protein